jgi:hypothetical protein
VSLSPFPLETQPVRLHFTPVPPAIPRHALVRPEKKQAGGLGGLTGQSVDFRVISLAGPSGPTQALKTLPSLSNNCRPALLCSSRLLYSSLLFLPRSPLPFLQLHLLFSPLLSATPLLRLGFASGSSPRKEQQASR